MKKVKIIFPDGSVGEVDEADVKSALSSGAKLFVDGQGNLQEKKTSVKFPDGSIGEIDTKDVDGAISSGATLLKKKESVGTGGQNVAAGAVVGTKGTSPFELASAEILKDSGASVATAPISFLDSDIAAQSSIDEQYKFDFSNPFIDEAVIDVKKDTQSLTDYNNRRISAINAQISEDAENLKGIYAAQGYGASNDATYQEIKRLEKKITTEHKYKQNLKSSIAAEVTKSIVPEYLKSDAIFEPSGLGREIIKVADPELELQYQDAEKLGSGLPSIQKANVERLGIDAAKNYLLSQPKSPENDKKLSEIDGLEKTFDERNVDLTAQIVREKLGVIFYNKGKGGFFGYSPENIEKELKDPANDFTDVQRKIGLEYVLPIERKLVFSTEIPGSGFFRGGKNAIERSIVSMANIGRQDSQRQFENLNQEIEQSRYRQPGQSPSMTAELNSLNNKEQSGAKLSTEEKSRKLELEKYVDVLSWNSKLFHGIGDLTGQVVQMALLTKGMGAVGRAATAFGESGGLLTGGMTSTAVGTALSNNTVGLFLNSFLQTKDSYESQALQLMPGDKNAANRKWYSTIMAMTEGAAEGIFNNVKILNAFTKGVSPTVADITNRFINKEITQQVAKEELQSALVKYLKPFAKSFVKSEAQESTEEGVVDLADGVSQALFGGQPFDIVKTGKQALNTFLTTALYSPLVAGMAAQGDVRQNNSQNAFYKSAIVDMGANPAPYLKSVEDLQLNGTIDQTQANEKIQLINSSNKYLKQIPETVTSKFGVSTVERKLEFPEVSSYLVHRLNEGILTQQLEHTTDPVEKNQIQAKIDRSIAIRQGIADGAIGVTPDIAEVTDNPKLANELGITHTSAVPAEDLAFTRFQPKPVTEEVKVESVAAPDVTNMFARDLLGEKKLDFVDLADPITGATERITARNAQMRTEKRDTLLKDFVTCITKKP